MDIYLLQTWNQATETWKDEDTCNTEDVAATFYYADPDNRRVLDNETRRILLQPKD